MALLLSHGGDYLFRDAVAPRDALVATVDGIAVLHRDNTAVPWEQRDRYLPGKHISALTSESSSGQFFAGTHGDGLFVQLDGAGAWEHRDEGISVPDIYALSQARVDGEVRLYAGTDEAHLYVSTDLGMTWRELPEVRTVPTADRWSFPGRPPTPKLKNVNFDPRSPEIIYASVEVGGLLRSDDAGRTWRPLDVPFDGWDVHRVVIPPEEPDWLYITGGDGIYRSRDAGATWEHLTDRSGLVAYPDSLLIVPDQPSVLFTGGSFTNPANWSKDCPANSVITRSTDGGVTWQTIRGGLPESIHGNVEAMCLASWTGGFSLFAGTTDGELYFSDDGGEHWNVLEGLPPISKTTHYRNLLRPAEAQAVGAR